MTAAAPATAEALKARVASREAKVAVIGLGYVGLPLATSFAREGYAVIGHDVDPKKVASLQRGESYILDVPSDLLREQVNAGRLTASTDPEVLRDADVIFVSVPTPFDRAKQPDLRFVVSAAESLAPRLRAGQLVILESTTYPGTTDEVMRPILERTGLVAGTDFFLAFSPERIDPGNKRFGIENTPKVVGGVDPVSTDLAAEILSRVVTKGSVQRVSSARAAELTKLLENTFRAVNIALVNELAMLCDRMGIDIWEVIDAASTKPYGFMPFYPGPGVGGHCLLTGSSVLVREGASASPRTIDALWAAVASRAIRSPGGVDTVPAPGFAVLGIGVDGPPEWERATHLFRREYDGDIVTVRAVDGREVAITDGHPMLVATSRGVEVRPAREIWPGDRLPALPTNAAALIRGTPRLAAPTAGPSPAAGHQRAGQAVLVPDRAAGPAYELIAVGSVETRAARTVVYSIETEHTHTFATGEGIFVHNCIPVDPYYLSWKAREFDFNTKFIELAAETNMEMPFFTAARVRRLLSEIGKPLHGARILVLGASFKKDIDDARNSAAIRVMEILRSEGAAVQYHDPFVPQVRLTSTLYASEGGDGVVLRSVRLTPDVIANADAVVILVGHSSVDYGAVVRDAHAVFDAVNATRALKGSGRVERL